MPRHSASGAARRRSQLLVAAAAALALSAGGTPRSALSADEAADPAAPATVVEELHQALIGVMRDATSLGYEGRYQRLQPVLVSHFDTPWMAQHSVGRHWRSMGEPEQERFVATVRRFMTANYAGRFDGYSGQDFETVKVEPSLHDTVLVYTRLNDPSGDATELDYRLRQVDGRWKIIDVFLNGTVSEVALRRSEYSALIKREGLDALIDALEGKISKLAAGGEPAPVPAASGSS